MYSIAFVISLVVFNQITISEASVCDYCKYCDYCGHCSECPCEKKKHCNLCSYCKYCSFCGACKTMCSEDSWIQQSLAALGWTSLENLETDEVKKDLEGNQLIHYLNN